MRIAVKGVGFEPVTLGEAADRCRGLMAEAGGHYVVTPNPEIVWLARQMPELKTALNGADLAYAEVRAFVNLRWARIEVRAVQVLF